MGGGGAAAVVDVDMIIGRDRLVVDRHVVWIDDVDAGFVPIVSLHALSPPTYTAIVL